MWWFIRLLGEKGVLVWFQSETRIHFTLGQEGHATSHCQIKHKLPPGRAPVTREQLKVPINTWYIVSETQELIFETEQNLLASAAVGAAARLVDNISETTTSSTCFCTWPHKGDATSTRGRAVKHMALGPEPSHQTVQSGQTTLERLWPTGSQESKNTTKKMCGAVQILYEATMGQHSFPKHPAAALLGFQPFIDCS